MTGRDFEERVPCWLGLFAVYGAHSAGACCTLCVAEFRHRGQPGLHACTCPLNRQETAAAAHPHACFSKSCFSTVSCTPLQHLWGSKAHTHRHTRAHTHRHTHVLTQTQAHTRTHTNTHTRTLTHTHMHMHAHVARVMGFAKFSA